jgi:geranylgeranylglycerol-phosphate geranylgeranyltransferase
MRMLFPPITREIVRDIRVLRILHYVVLALLGIALLGQKENVEAFFISEETMLVFPLFIVALAYAAVFAIVTNNIEDLEADRLTNPTRPLVLGTVNKRHYLMAGVFCLVYSLLLSLLVQKEMFYGILAISAGYYIYSCRPFRIKRIPIVSKLFIGANSLVVAVCGYVLAGGAVKEFPLAWAMFILLPLSLSANFVDLKDTEGDRKMGVKTLPVLFGEKNAKGFIAACTICTYLVAAILINILWFYPLVLFVSLLHCYLLYRKPYNEKPVFVVYITGLVGLELVLFFHKYLTGQ